MTKYTLLGEKIAYCRKKLNLSKKEFAYLIKVSPSTVSKYESGASIPSSTKLFIISLVTDMMMEDFIDETISLEEFIAIDEKTIFELALEFNNEIKTFVSGAELM